MNTWVLVANSNKARLFNTERIGDEMVCVREFEHPESRQKGSELTSDRPGHYQSKGTGHGAFVETTDPRDNEVEKFADELADVLDKGRANNEYKKLVIVAAPHFMGLLNNHMDEKTRSFIISDINKDFTSYEDRELPERLREYLKK
jgi:protein required for attachment to host cells